MPNLSARTVYTKDAAVCKVRINVDMTISDKAIQQTFVSLKTAMNGTLQLGVRQPYLTRFLSLEYGVAGLALPEKELFGTVATQVLIPARKPYMKWHNGKYTNYLVYYTKHGSDKMTLFQVGDNPIITKYTGVPPKHMVRNHLPELERQLKEIPARIIQQRFKNGPPLKGPKWSADSELEILFRKEMNTLGKWLKKMVQEDTPVGNRTPERMGQLERWNQNYPDEQRPLGHLATDGYFFEVVRK